MMDHAQVGTLRAPDHVFAGKVRQLAGLSVAAAAVAAACGWALVFVLTNNPAAAAGISAIPAAWALIAVYVTHETTIRKFWLLRRGKLEQAAMLPSDCARTAAKSSDLLDKLERVLADGGSLRAVTGGDCRPMVAEGHDWPSLAQHFLCRGCHVALCAVAPSAEADERFVRLTSQFKQFTYHKMPQPSGWMGLAAEARALLAYFGSCHPALAESVGGNLKMLWLEQRHPPRAAQAHQGQYWSPSDIQAAPSIYDDMRSLLDSAWSAAQTGQTPTERAVRG